MTTVPSKHNMEVSENIYVSQTFSVGDESNQKYPDVKTTNEAGVDRIVEVGRDGFVWGMTTKTGGRL